MPTREDNALTLGEIVAYAGPETDWQPRVAIQQTSPVRGLERLPWETGRAYVGIRTFDSIRQAVHWAKDNHYDGVTMPVTFLTPQPR